MQSFNINIGKDFSKAPGPRYMVEGRNSGEEFREKIFAPRMRDAIQSNSLLVIDLDGTAGYGTSFLEEIFGGLIRENHFPYSQIKKALKIKSEEEPYLIEDIEQFLLDAREELKNQHTTA